MFGHDDNKNQADQEEHVTGSSGDVVQPISTTPPNEGLIGVGAAKPSASPTTTGDDDSDDDIDKIVDDINQADDTSSVPAPPPTPSVDDNEPEPEAEPVAEPEPEPAPELSTNREGDQAVESAGETPAELMEVKKSALQELSPLLDELDQPADEKLAILMMTIQATDDQSLLAKALEEAKKIDDKKARAEAMLDIIQEINYFTKKS